MAENTALVVLSLLLAIVPATAAPRGKADGPAFRPAAVSPVLKSEMARYSLSAFENCDATNALKALLYTPKPVGRALLPMVVYLPGKGELGELEAQFRQRAIFDRGPSAAAGVLYKGEPRQLVAFPQRR